MVLGPNGLPVDQKVYTFPTDGTQPVILGPNGLPVDPNFGVHAYKDDDLPKMDHPSELHGTPGYGYGDAA